MCVCVLCVCLCLCVCVCVCVCFVHVRTYICMYVPTTTIQYMHVSHLSTQEQLRVVRERKVVEEEYLPYEFVVLDAMLLKTVNTD